MLTLRQAGSKEGHRLECASCKCMVGIETDKTQYFQLFKWTVALKIPGQTGRKTFPLGRVLSTQLLAAIENYAVHKFLVHAGDLEHAKEALFVSKGQYVCSGKC